MRFYKTTPGKFLDYMHKLPREEMLKAIEVADTQIAKTEEDLRKQEDLLKLQATDIDTPYARQITQGYMAEIDEMARQIQKDPLSFRRTTPEINSLRRRIQENLNYGDASVIQKNFDRREENLKAMKTMYEKNPDKFNYDDIMKLQDILDQEYSKQGGYKGGVYGTERLAEYQDLKDFDKFGKDWKATITEKLGAYKSPKTGLLYTSKDYKEEVKGSDIEAAIMDMIENDDKLKAYYDQQIKLGNFTREEVKDRFKETAQNIGEKYGYLKTSKGSTSVKADSRDAATAAVDRQYDLNNPTNTTPGVIQSKTIFDKYGLHHNKTMAGIDAGLGQIETLRQDLVSQAITSLGSQGQIVTPEIQKSIESGDFSKLNEYGFSKGVISHFTNRYKEFDFDQRLFSAMKDTAEASGNADAWLNKHKDSENAQFLINEMPGNSFRTASDRANYAKTVKAHREEIANGVSWHDKEITLDKGDLEKLPTEHPLRKNFYNNGNVKPTSVYELTELGIIKPSTDTEYIKPEYDPKDMIGKVPRPGAEPLPGTGINVEKKGLGYENFEVKPHSKFATALDSEDNVIIQSQMELDGYGVDFYIDESSISNKTIKENLDTGTMRAQNMYNKAKSSGVITEDGFYIEGVKFFMNDGIELARTPDGRIVTPSEAIGVIGLRLNNK